MVFQDELGVLDFEKNLPIRGQTFIIELLVSRIRTESKVSVDEVR